MALIPTTSAVPEVDPKDSTWVEKLTRPINAFILQTRNALSSLTLANHKAKNHTFLFTYLASSPPTNLSFSWPYNEPPSALLVARVELLDATALSAAIQPVWYYNNGFVIVRYFVGGFTNTERYKITVTALA